MSLTWLHISDLHLPEKVSGNEYLSNSKTIAHRELCNWIRAEKVKPDLIFFTGDFAHKGQHAVLKESTGKPSLATTFFDDLRKAANLDRERLFIVPGNHDVSREAMIKKKLKRSLDTKDEYTQYFTTCGNLKAGYPHIAQGLKCFSTWYNNYFKGIREEYPQKTTCSLQTLSIKGHKISILLLNSTMFCFDSDTDSGKLVIGKDLLDTALHSNGKVDMPELTLALVHHPLSYLSWIEKRTVTASLIPKTDLLLLGHNHETGVDWNDYPVIASGSMGEGRQQAIICRYHNNLLRIEPLCFASVHKIWTRDTEVFRGNQTEDYCESNSLPLKYRSQFSYREQLRSNIGSITLFGLPGVNPQPLPLDDQTFVKLKLGLVELFLQKTGKRPKADTTITVWEQPEEVLRFCKDMRIRLLLVTGDVGGGKTTLLHYFGLCCLNHVYNGPWNPELLGFTGYVPVFYLPLHELLPAGEKSETYAPLPEQLSAWASRNNLNMPITSDDFKSWLSNGKSLVLFDGLDEIVTLKERQSACKWIDQVIDDFRDSTVVVTSRKTGYGKLLGVTLQRSHVRVEVLDLDKDKQKDFLEGWMKAACFAEAGQRREDSLMLKALEDKAKKQARTLCSYLHDDPRNSALRQLSPVPMMLQLMAMLWKSKSSSDPQGNTLPPTRLRLYQTAVDYLLEFRDKQRDITPLLPHELSRMIIGPIALGQQQQPGKPDGGTDREVIDEMFLLEKIGDVIADFNNPPSAQDFCNFLVERAALLVRGACSSYTFRHKSFREYLAGVELARQDMKEAIPQLLTGFGDPWWEETIRFCMSEARNAQFFDCFMDGLFTSPESLKLKKNQELLLLSLIDESEVKRSDALEKWLLKNDDTASAERQHLLLQCLGKLKRTSTIPVLEKFLKMNTARTEQVNSKAREVLEGLGGTVPDTGASAVQQFADAERGALTVDLWNVQLVQEGKSTLFRLPFEYNAEYILIRGTESFRYSGRKKPVKVDDRYFARYPVTNRRYRRFIDYLSGKNKEFAERLEVGNFERHLKMIAESKAWDGKYRFADYLKEKADFAERFRSKYDDDRKFGGDDQPVVGVSWYDAQAYCHWLSLVESGGQRDDLYRLPDEKEWEWAAGGGKRKFPWGDPEPDETRANYGQNVGQTTPVGSYPAGATPEGLYDMAGNVWEWQENLYKHKEYPGVRAVRGGSWFNFTDFLRCVARNYFIPVYRYDFNGFRVVRPSPL
jgi:formylglycine-generating enzyme required for sulfatase activity/predicted phosphodiesterase